MRGEDLDAKDALLAIAPRGFFTIPHFDGHAAILIALRIARASDVRAAIVDAWRCMGGDGSPAKRQAGRKGAARSAPRRAEPHLPRRQRRNARKHAR